MVAVVAANLYVIFFNFSWGPVMWVMLGEMFPNQIRGSALAVSGFVQWFANFLISFSFPVMAASWSLTGSYVFYGVCAVISFFLVQKLRARDARARNWRRWRAEGLGRGRRLAPCPFGVEMTRTPARPFRSREWFDAPGRPRHGRALSRALHELRR